jgi:hypothetical protein
MAFIAQRVGDSLLGSSAALPAALDADWLTAAWDQNAYNYVTGPAAAVVEECEPQTACGH